MQLHGQNPPSLKSQNWKFGPHIALFILYDYGFFFFIGRCLNVSASVSFAATCLSVLSILSPSTRMPQSKKKKNLLLLYLLLFTIHNI
jgi:hypothetical protein